MKVAQSPNQNFFQIANEAKHVLTIGTQIDDRICDDLAGPVVGNFSPAICLKDTHAAFLKNFVWNDNPVIFRTAPARQSVRMLQQQQSVGLGARQNCALCLFLNGECRPVFSAAQSFDSKNSLHDLP